MVNARRSSPRRTRKTFSVSQTYRLAGKNGQTVEFEATIRIFGCGAWGAVVSRPLLGILDDIQKTLAERGFSEGERDVFIDGGSRPLKRLEARPKRRDRDLPVHTGHDVPSRQSKDLGDQESVP